MRDFYREGFDAGCKPVSFYMERGKQYRPGGPWVMAPKERDRVMNPAFYEECQKTVAGNAAWNVGFDDGRVFSANSEKVVDLAGK